MKAHRLILAIPILVFFSLSITLSLGRLLPLYPERDETPYLASRSLLEDFDLAYTRTDSDRYFKENLRRPSHFSLIKKQVITSSGEPKSYAAFYSPGLYHFFLAPFTKLMHFQGIFLFHTVLIGVLYSAGFLYYRNTNEDTVLPALNSVLYYALVPLPILFLMPSHHLFLLTACSLAISFGLRKQILWSSLFLSLAFSVEPWSLLLGFFLISYWQYSGFKSEPVRFFLFTLIGVLAVSGSESLMYTAGSVSDVRWLPLPQAQPLAQIWKDLPAVKMQHFAVPSLQRVIDFLFGRSIGFFVYGFTAGALLMSCVLLWRDRLVSRALLFFTLCLIVISVTDPSSWRLSGFVNDWWILICAVAFYVAPLVRPLRLFVLISVMSLFLVGPLLVNPMGAIINRDYYLQAFPYQYLPVELSLIGKVGLTANPAYRLEFPKARIYFLNDHFYPENDFFWVRGEATVEFLLERDEEKLDLMLKILNGSGDNRVKVILAGKAQNFRMAGLESAFIDLSPYAKSMKEQQGHYYLHGKITSSSGAVPKFLSRDSLDYRYLGCQVQLIDKSNQQSPLASFVNRR